LATGEVADLHNVMIASQKAEIALQFTVQVRNLLIQAYNELGRLR
jgi:flagellar hook-basal body complex protein FliE